MTRRERLEAKLVKRQQWVNARGTKSSERLVVRLRREDPRQRQGVAAQERGLMG